VSIDIISAVYYYNLKGWNYIMAQALDTICKTIKDEEIQVVYKLIYKDSEYGIECLREGMEGRGSYCRLENLTEDEYEAERFLQLVAEGKVYPIHIRDLAEDYFC
jgi:hypothetical protein